jgi:adenosylhomocysteinase
MDMSFENQALSAEYMLRNSRKLKRLKLNAMGVKIDKLTPEQKKYLASWEMGT